jgi:5,10-methylenetetrahydromethanopterin reductase
MSVSFATEVQVTAPTGADVVRRGTMTGTHSVTAATLRKLDDAGAAAVPYQPAGHDIARELRAFSEAADRRHAPTAASTSTNTNTTEIRYA